MKLIVGLGNPGKKYETTRHNLGFMVVEGLAKEWRVSLRAEKKFSALVARSRQKEAVLAQPQLFMNRSGIAVVRIANFYKLKPADIWVIHDDVDLPLEKLKIVRDRGSAGHKGVMSVIQELGSTKFVRFRLGIGHPHAGRRREGGKWISKFDSSQEVEDFVLAPFSTQERDEVKKLIRKTVAAIDLAFEKGIKQAMNRLN